MPAISKFKLSRRRNLLAKKAHLPTPTTTPTPVVSARSVVVVPRQVSPQELSEVPSSSGGLHPGQEEEGGGGDDDEASVKVEVEEQRIKLEEFEEEKVDNKFQSDDDDDDDDEEEIPLPPTAPPAPSSDPLECGEEDFVGDPSGVTGGEVVSGGADRCLLCYSTCRRMAPKKSSSKRRSGGGKGAGAAASRHRQPPSYVMFILKRLLRVPEGLLEECYLRSKNFNNWMTLCDSCSQLVHYCVGVNDQIARLLEELQTHRHRITERVKKKKKKGTSSFTGNTGGGGLDQRDNSDNFVTNAVRDCVAKKEYPKSEEICCCFPAGDNGTAARVEAKLRIALHFKTGGGGGGGGGETSSRSSDKKKKRVAPKRGHDVIDDIPPPGAQSVPAKTVVRPTKRRSLSSKPSNLKTSSKKSKNVGKLVNDTSTSPPPSPPPDPLDNDDDDDVGELLLIPSPSPAHQSPCASATLFSSATSKVLIAPPKDKVPSLLRRRPVKGLGLPPNKSRRKSPIVTPTSASSTNSSSKEAKTTKTDDDGDPPSGNPLASPPNPKFPEVYTCNLCGGGGKMDVHNFLSHILFHQERPYRCSDCDSYLPRDESHREAHWEKYHGGVQAEFRFLEVGGLKAFHCVICPKTFQTDLERDRHLQDVHEITPVAKTLPCKSCELKFAANDELLIHRALAHPEVARFSCPVCDEVFIKKCDNNGADILDQRALQAHLDAEHSALSIPIVKSCPYCGSRFSSSNPDYAMDMQVHLKRLHGKSVEVVYGCKYCDESLPSDTATNLRGHMRQHKKEAGAYARPPLQKWQWIEPLISLSPADADKFRVVKELIQCPNCVQAYTKEDLLKKHMDTVHQPPRLCHLCGWKGKLACEMRRHAFVAHGVVEEGATMLHCPQEGCTFQTVSKRDLSLHVARRHNPNARKHVCRHCGKAFKCSTHRRQHELIHVNAKSKPYQCEICGNSFALRNYLYIHKRLSHEGRTFPSTHKKKKPRAPKMKKRRQQVTNNNDDMQKSSGNNNNAEEQAGSRTNNAGEGEGGSILLSMDLACHETLPEEN